MTVRYETRVPSLGEPRKRVQIYLPERAMNWLLDEQERTGDSASHICREIVKREIARRVKTKRAKEAS